MVWLTQPATIEKQKWQTKIEAWWTFIQGKGGEGQQMAFSQ